MKNVIARLIDDQIDVEQTMNKVKSEIDAKMEEYNKLEIRHQEIQQAVKVLQGR